MFEYFIVEVLYRYVPLRWCEYGSTLLMIPGAGGMTVPEVMANFRERYCVASKLPCVKDNPSIIEFALQYNLPPR